MSASNGSSSFPRTISFGASQLQYSGPGRAPSSLIYFEPNSGKFHELLPARVVFAGSSGATAVFENSNLPPAKILGDALRAGLAVGTRLLCEIARSGAETTLSHWFIIATPKSPARMPPTPSPAPVVTVTGIITKVADNFRWGFAQTPAGETYFVHASERHDGQPLLLHARIKFNPGFNEKGKMARNVRAA